MVDKAIPKAKTLTDKDKENAEKQKGDAEKTKADAEKTNTGVKTYRCACGATKTESIPAKGHTWCAVYATKTVQTGTTNCVIDLGPWTQDADGYWGHWNPVYGEVPEYQEVQYIAYYQCGTCGATKPAE